MVLDGGAEDPRAIRQRGGHHVDRLRRVADEHHLIVERAPTRSATAARAFSNAAVDTRDFAPVPRCTLLYHGTNASTAAHTSAITGVLAALSRFT